MTPIIRIPPNGGEMNQWLAKQVLDIGAYGVVWPHVSTVEQAYNAVAACRYPRPKGAGVRAGRACAAISPCTPHATGASRRRSTTRRPTSGRSIPEGEILVIIMCEDVGAIDNLPRILKEVPGIGVVLIGEGDLSQNLGYPRQYDHPAVVEAMTAIRRICEEHGVAVRPPARGRAERAASDR